MPISLLEPLPIPDLMTADFFWPGLALLLVNGVPNIVALILRHRGDIRGFHVWGLLAGVLLVVGTVFEMVFIPNGVSLFYAVLGVLQFVANLRLLKA